MEKTFNSFNQMAAFMEVKEKKLDENWKQSQRKKMAKCPKCGGEMEHFPKTNMFVCHGEVKGEGGKTTPCEHYRLVSDGLSKLAALIF